MNCRQFRESLDCYVDGELSPEASAAADTHRQECPQCGRAAARPRDLKATVRRTVSAGTPPAGLEARIRGAAGPSWTRSLVSIRSMTPTRRVAGLAAAAVLILAATVTWAPIDIGAADAMDRVALRLSEASPVVLEGTVRCRDCELAHRHGVQASCAIIGHRGAIATADGRIWNIVEQPGSARLIHDETLLGRSVVVSGRLFRSARALVVERYVLGS